jgi:tRNA A-37 threonylcarbamoyl transferase component Bud32
MGCCVTTKDKCDKLEITMSNIFANNSNCEFVDISLLSDDESQEQKIKDWRLNKYSGFASSDDSFEIMSTILQSERKILMYGKADSIIDSFCSNLSQSVIK